MKRGKRKGGRANKRFIPFPFFLFFFIIKRLAARSLSLQRGNQSMSCLIDRRDVALAVDDRVLSQFRPEDKMGFLLKWLRCSCQSCRPADPHARPCTVPIARETPEALCSHFVLFPSLSFSVYQDIAHKWASAAIPPEFPENPHLTGLLGRGLLGDWGGSLFWFYWWCADGINGLGGNRSVDELVTRWKRNAEGQVIERRSKRLLECVIVRVRKAKGRRGRGGEKKNKT